MKKIIMIITLCASTVSYAEKYSFTPLFYFQEYASLIARESNILLSADKKFIYGHRDRFIYKYSLDNGSLDTLTNAEYANYQGALTLSKNEKYIYGANHGRYLDYVFRFNLENQTEEILHGFSSSTNYADGYDPMGGLVLDANENYLYGVTTAGGLPFDSNNRNDSPWNHGVVYRITLDGAPNPTYQVIHHFKGDANGGSPEGSLIMSPNGKYLYGISTVKGAGNCGTVFQLSLEENKKFPFKTLHSFDCLEVGIPNDLIGSVDGRYLYGTAFKNNWRNNKGVVFQVDLLASDNPLTILHRFDSPEGLLPIGLVLSKNQKTLFGATELGGRKSPHRGSIYKIELDKPNFPLTILHVFDSYETTSMQNPMVLNEDSGELYGETRQGTGIFKNGAIFKLKP
jgi:hypothetical protein